jgi:acetate---CoA ligase (ADP-forming)
MKVYTTSNGLLGDQFNYRSSFETEEAYSMIHSLRAYKIIQGTRGQKGVNEDKFAEIIVRLSTLLRFATEIKEMDINPLLATQKAVIAVDARIRIEK